MKRGASLLLWDLIAQLAEEKMEGIIKNKEGDSRLKIFFPKGFFYEESRTVKNV